MDLTNVLLGCLAGLGAMTALVLAKMGVRNMMVWDADTVSELLAVIEGLPEDVRIEQLHEGERVFHLVWLGGQRFPVGEFFYHFHDDHEPDIRAWLARTENQ